tara:strand:+ start:236 stop:523 length:288 start_codon:yes stop_codon:yes gene_type:complete
MTRSVWKGPFVEASLLKKAKAVSDSGKREVIRTWSRKSTIVPQFVGLTFGVYNGRKFIPVSVDENMVGHKFGEFSPTRTFKGHSTADKKMDVKKS